MKKLLLLLLCIPLVFSCSKESCDSSPTISNPIASNINYTSVSISGQINPSDCNDEVISQGILISESELPTTSDYLRKINTSGNSFVKDIDALEVNTRYFVRTFFVNNDGEFYSSQISFDTYELDVVFENFDENFTFTELSVKADFKFKEGNGFNDFSKGVIFNNKTVVDDTSNNRIEAINNEYSQNSDFHYKFFVQTPLGKFESQSFSGKTTSAGVDFTNFSVANITYRSGEVSINYKNHYDGNDLTTEKGFILKEINSPNESKILSLDPYGEMKFNVDTLRSTNDYKITAFVSNPHKYNSTEIQFSTKDSPYNVGQLDQGGMIVALDYTGWRGIVVAPRQIAKKLQWSDNLNSSNNLDLHWRYENFDKYTSYDSTKKIIDYYSQISASAPAAEYAWNLEYNGYDDWHLPNNTDFQYFMRYLNKIRQNDSQNTLYDPSSDYYFDFLGDDIGAVWFWMANSIASGTTESGNRALRRAFLSQSELAAKDDYCWVMPIRRFNY